MVNRGGGSSRLGAVLVRPHACATLLSAFSVDGDVQLMTLSREGARPHDRSTPGAADFEHERVALPARLPLDPGSGSRPTARPQRTPRLQSTLPQTVAHASRPIIRKRLAAGMRKVCDS